MPATWGLLWRLRFTWMQSVAKTTRDATAFFYFERHAGQLAHTWFMQLVEGALDQAELRLQLLGGLPYLELFGTTPSACPTASASGHMRCSYCLFFLPL